MRLAAALVTLGMAAYVPRAEADADPKAAEARFAEGRHLLNQRKFAEAIAELRKAYDLDPRPEYLFRLALAYHLSGDAANALEQYRKYLAGDPKGKLAETAQRYVVMIEAERAAAEAEVKAQAEADKESHADSERVAAARVRLDQTNARIAQLQSDIVPRTTSRAEAVVAAEAARVQVAAADAEVLRWRRSAYAAPIGRGRAYRIGGTALMVVGAAMIGAGAWFASDASTLSGQLSALNQPQWTVADDALVSRGLSSAHSSLVISPIGGIGVLGGLLLDGVGESKLTAHNEAALYRAQIEAGAP